MTHLSLPTTAARLFAAMALAIAMVLLLQAPPANAAEPTSVTDCFGGALSADPVHCTVIQNAHNQGVMTVEVMYTASQGRLLYIFITQERSALEGIFDRLKAMSTEEITRLDDDSLCPLRDGWWCQPGTFRALGAWTMMPQSATYDDVLLRSGGTAGRRTQSGWASFVQVWPVVASSTAVTRSATAAAFDVSDVDTTNFPAIDCLDRFAGHMLACQYRQIFPNIGLARWANDDDGIHYVDVKALPGQEEQAVAAALAAVAEYFNRPEGDTGGIVITPVKHSYEELWRWKIILERFALSAGNTVGISLARLDDSVIGDHGSNIEFPVPGLGRVAFADRDRLGRATIQLGTLNLSATLAALPKLLPQLGIPVDAVGVVQELDLTPFPGGAVESSTNNGSETATTANPTTESASAEPKDDSSIATESVAIESESPTSSVSGGLIGAIAIGALAVGGLAVVTMRRRRT